MTKTAPNRSNNRTLAEISTWWLMLAIFAAAALIPHATRAGAQQTAGPLPAATPSDQPPPSPRASAPAQIGGKPNLSGAWNLNKDESDDPREALQAAGANRGGGGGSRVHVGMGGGGVGMGGGGGMGGRRRAGQNGDQNAGQNAMNDLSSLTIEQTTTSATVTSESGRVLAKYVADSASQSNAITTNNNSSAQSGGSSSSDSDPYPQGDSASTPAAAQWKGSQLVAVSSRGKGTITRTYELSPDAKQLYVTTKIDNTRLKKPATFRLVYDPAQSGG